MTSSKPYLIRALYDWIVDNGCTPHLLVETKDTHGSEQRAVPAGAAREARTSAELLEKITGHAIDSPLCFTCGTKMRPAGSCYVCEGCGSTSGCS